MRLLAIFAVTILLVGCSKSGEKSTTTQENTKETIPSFSEVLKAEQLTSGGTINITYPLDETMFPPEIIAPEFKWKDTTAGVNRWVISFLNDTNLLEFGSQTPSWIPDFETWQKMKSLSKDLLLTVNIIGYNKAEPTKALSFATTRIQTSSDEVGAPIFYREVILPFIDAVIDPSKLRWRFGSVDMPDNPPIVLEGLPVCGNCHSFTQDGSVLAMDVDYANSKGSYVTTKTMENMKLNTSDIFSWDDFKKEDGELTFGLLSQISPDGRYVLSTVKDKSVFVPMPGLEYSQLFFPIKGIVAIYNRNTQEMKALKGADDPKYVSSNPTWSPDGKTVLIARSESYDLKNTVGAGKTLLTRAECKEFVEDGKPFRFNIYKIPFNEGEGGEAVPLEGANEEGVSSYFPKYSPDGKWIVFCKASSYMLLQKDSKMYIMPAEGGIPRLMRCNTPEMNSWHSWSPNGKWLVFSSKANGPYTQLWLTHIDEQGESTPPVVLAQFTESDRAANIPEFVNLSPNAIKKIEPNFINDISWCRAGDECYRNGKTDDAIANYKKALSINENCYRAHQKLGFFYFNVLKQEQLGLEHMVKALQLEPRYAMSQYDYGMANLKMGNFETAKQHIARAIELVPRGIDLQYEAGEMRFQLARAYLFLGDINKASEILEYINQIRPKYAEAYYLLAGIKANTDLVEEAVPLLHKAISLKPQVDRNPDLHANIAMFYIQTEQYALALPEAERALALAKNSNNQNMVADMQNAIMQLRKVLQGQ